MADSGYVPERRPIATRDKAWSKRLAARLAETGVTPNAISISGMFAGILAGAAFAYTRNSQSAHVWFVLGAGLMQIRLLANMLDGIVAMQTAQASPVGELFNEVPDRVSDSAIFIGAGYAAGGIPALGYLAALTAVFTAYVRAAGKVAGAHQEFCGPMAKPQRMALMSVAALYVGFAPATWQPRFDSLPDWGVIAWALLVVVVGSLATALRRLGRIANALRKEYP